MASDEKKWIEILNKHYPARAINNITNRKALNCTPKGFRAGCATEKTKKYYINELVNSVNFEQFKEKEKLKCEKIFSKDKIEELLSLEITNDNIKQYLNETAVCVYLMLMGKFSSCDDFVIEDLEHDRGFEETEDLNVNKNNVDMEVIEEREESIMEEYTGYYLIRIEKVENHYNGTFFNIIPIMRELGDSLEEFSKHDVEEKFPPRGKIQISGWQSRTTGENLEGYYWIYLPDSFLSTCEIKEDGTIKIKYDDYSRRIHSIDDYFRRDNKSSDEMISVKEIITVPESFLLSDVYSWRSISIQKPITKKVYLRNNEKIAGPFYWQQGEDGNFNFTTVDNNFMVDLYSYDELLYTPNIFEFEGNYSDEIRTVFLENTNSLLLKKDKLDCIDDENLKNYLGRILAKKETGRKEQKKIRELVEDLPNEELSNSRKERMLEMFINTEIINEFLDIIPELVLSNETACEKLVQTIFENENYIENEIFEKYIKRHDDYDITMQTMIATEMKRMELENKGVPDKDLQEKVDRLEKENREKTEKIEFLREKLSLDEYKEQEASFLKRIGELKPQVENLEQRRDTWRDATKDVGSKIGERISEAYTELFNKQFDEELSNVIIDAAAKYKKQNEDEELKRAVVENNDTVSRSDIVNIEGLVQFLYDELNNKAKREVEKNDIVNILLCISQGFLTILAGEPGSGKTSLVNFLAILLGLENDNFRRYVEVPVEKGWTSRRDFIGYYNPLNKTFETSNKQILNAFLTLKEEAANKIERFPYWILLDEANLSQMEYYWADFMSLCDFDKLNRKLVLSEELEISIPQTLRFLATINLDNTTEALSPRLIDRAWIITLESPEISLETYTEVSLKESYPLVSFEVLKPLYDSELWETKELPELYLEKLAKIYSCFKDEVNIKLSPRVIGMVQKYCLAGQKYFDDDVNKYVALDYAVAQKVLPQINGYGENYKNLINKLLEICDENRMPKCNALLKTILKTGENNMQYYQFFAR